VSKKEPSASNRESLGVLRARAIATIDFVEARYDFPSGAVFRDAIENAAGTGNLRLIKVLSREIDKMATVSLPKHERDGLDAVLQDQLGVSREVERDARSVRIANALKRGGVASEVERRHLEDYMEELAASGDDPDLLDAIRRLLAAS